MNLNTAQELADKIQAMSEILYAATTNDYEPLQKSLSMILDMQETMSSDLVLELIKQEKKT